MRPVTEHEVLTVVHVRVVCPEAVAVTVYPVTAEPPFHAGALQLAVAVVPETDALAHSGLLGAAGAMPGAVERHGCEASSDDCVPHFHAK